MTFYDLLHAHWTDVFLLICVAFFIAAGSGGKS